MKAIKMTPLYAKQCGFKRKDKVIMKTIKTPEGHTIVHFEKSDDGLPIKLLWRIRKRRYETYQNFN